MHYSRSAGHARKNYLRGKETEFEIFNSSQKLVAQDIIKIAELIIKHKKIDSKLANNIRTRLDNKELTESRKSLLFYYKNTFDLIKNIK